MSKIIGNCGECNKPPEKVQFVLDFKYVDFWLCDKCVEKANQSIQLVHPEDYGEEVPMGTILRKF